MDLGIKNKKAVVTGAGRGIGKSIFCQGSIFPVDGGQSRHYFWTGDD